MNYHSSSGNTLIEMVLYMGLLSIFLFILFEVFATILSVQTRSNSVSLVQTNGNYLLAKLSYDIHQADSISSPLAIGDSAVSLILTTNGVNSVYSQNNGNLQVNDGTGLYQLNDTDTSITDLVFERLGNIGGKNALKINFTLNSLIVGNTATKSADFQIVVSLR